MNKETLLRLIPITLLLILCSIFVRAEYSTQYDYTNFSSGNTFSQSYSGWLREDTGYTSDGGIALYNLALNPSGTLEDQWGSSDGTRNNGQSGVVFDGSDDYINVSSYVRQTGSQTWCANVAPQTTTNHSLIY